MILAIPKCDPDTPVILDAPDEIISIFDGSFCEDNSFNKWHEGQEPGIYRCEVAFHFTRGYFEGYRADGESAWYFTVTKANKIGYSLPDPDRLTRIKTILKRECEGGYLHNFHDFEKLSLQSKRPDIVESYLDTLSKIIGEA